jgi:hypothetical protein
MSGSPPTRPSDGERAAGRRDAPRTRLCVSPGDVGLRGIKPLFHGTAGDLGPETFTWQAERLVGRSEFRPARLPVRLASSQVASEILDMRLPAGPVLVQNGEGKAALLVRESCLLALGGEHSLDHGLVVGSQLHRDHQVVRRVADIDAPWATSMGIELSTDGGKTWQLVLKDGGNVMFGPVA